MRFQHVPNEGWKFSSDLGEFVIASASRQKEGVVFDDKEVADYCSAMHNFLAGMRGFTFVPEISSNATAARSEYLDHCGPVYKYITDLDWRRYYSKGSIKIDRLEAYTSEEYGKGPQDFWEGFGSIFVFDGVCEHTLFFRAMPAAHIFCGTHSGTYQKELAQRFGDRFIKIRNPDAFFRILSEKTNTKFRYNKRVVYSALKAIRYDEAYFSDRFHYLWGRLSSPHGAITGNCRRFVSRLFEKAHDVAVLSKPNSVITRDHTETKVFDIELETRAVFASSIDQRGPIITGNSDEIAKQIELVR